MRLFGVITSRIVTLSILLLIFGNTLYASEEVTKIRIGIYQNYPLVGQKMNGEPQGLFVDILNKIATQEGWETVFILDSFSNCLNRLNNDELDLVAAIAQTEERDEIIDFSKENVCTLWGTVYVQPHSQIQTILDLDGKIIAIMSKGIFGRAFKKLCNDFNIKPQFLEVESQGVSLELLKAKKVDAATFNNAFKKVYSESGISRTSITYSPMKIVFAANKGKNHELLNAIDAALSKWKENENSFYYQSLKKWLGVIEIPKKVIPQWLIFGLFCTISISVMFFIWLVSLRKQIMQRKIAEEALKDSENRFRSLSDAAFEGILFLDKGIIIDANDTIATMYGFLSPTDLIGMKAIDLVSLEDREEVQNKILSGYEEYYEISGLKKDGSSFPIEAQGKMFSYKGKQIRVTAIRDLTEQKKAEQEIKTLRGIIPICSYCKKIRDDEGIWSQLEAYIHSHSDAKFSHGACPECFKKQMEEND